MRIGYLIPGWPPDKVPSGIAATIGRLGDALEQLGHEVYFLTSQRMDGEDDHRVSVISSKTQPNLLDRLRSKLDFGQAVHNKTASAIRDQLNVLVSEKKIEIFQMEETHGWVNMVAKALPIPLVARLHGPWFTQAGIVSLQKPQRSDIDRIEREGLAIRSAFAITAPSDAVLQSTRNFYGNVPELSKVIPNPIPLPAVEGVWNHEICDKSTLLFVGRFDEVKGGDVVLRAFSELLKARPALRLNFVGPDTGIRVHNGELIHFSEFVRGELSIEATSRVNYLGTLPRSMIDALRKMAALTIIASRYETFGNVVGEAMAVGVPIVATSVGGIPELLENQRNAILIEPGNPSALASACLTLIDNPELAVKLATQARIDCSNKYHPEEIARQTVEFYTKVIKKFSQRKPQN